MSDSAPLPDRPAPDVEERFCQLWGRGLSPDVDDFLRLAGELSTPETAVILRVDQRERWRRGEPVLAESYLARHPKVTADSESTLDLIFNEYLLREQCCATADPDEFLRRFPEHAEVLRAQIELHLAVAADLDETCPPSDSEGESDGPLPDVPGYEILGEIGRGGMGVIYRARQRGLNRSVALKMISAGACAGAPERSRFRTEAEAIARLQHPNVVQIYEIGSFRGMPYLALEYMEGGNLARRLRGKPLPPRQGAELIELLARAVHVAHTNGIVHRDLKPANVLFTNGAGPQTAVPKISDFGLAKDLAGRGDQTSSGTIVATPAYMAPEQADGEAKHVGPAADVYALGAMLYEVLTGRPPFQGATVLGTLLQVRTSEPRPPASLQAGLPRDLVTVCLKALAKEPGRRYATAAALADDLGLYLNDLPVTARPVKHWERVWRRCRRNPALAGSLAVSGLLLVLALFAGGVATLIHRERNVAVAAKEQAEFERERAENAERHLAVRSHLYRATAYRRSGQAGQRFKCLAELRAALKLDPSPDQRREIRNEAAAALALPDVEVAAEWDGWPEGTVAVDFDDSLSGYARLFGDGTVTLHRLDSGKVDEVNRFRVTGDAPFSTLSLSPTGEFVAIRHAAHGSSTRVAFTVWRLDWGRALPPRLVFVDDQVSNSDWVGAFGVGKSRVWVYCRQDSVRARNLDTGGICWDTRLGAAAHSIAAQPGGDTVALDQGHEVLLLDPETGKVRRRLSHADPKITEIWSLAWHPEGRRLATACDDLRIHLWDVDSGEEVARPWTGHFDQGIRIAFNRSGDRLVTFDYSRQTQLWDATAGRSLMTLPSLGLHRLSRTHDLLGPQRVGRQLRLYRVATGRELQVLQPCPGRDRTFISHPVVDAEDRVVAAMSGEGPCFFDLCTGKQLTSVRTPFPDRTGLCGFIPPGGWIMSASTGPNFSGSHFWPARRDKTRPEVLQVGPPRFLSTRGGRGAYASPDGKVLAMDERGSALIVNREAPLRREFHTGAQSDVRGLAISPDRNWVVTCSWTPDTRSSIQVWDARTGAHVRDLPVLDSCNLAWFSPDNHWLFTTALGAVSRLWETSTWQEVRTYDETTVAFAPTARGGYMALTGGAGQIRLVDPSTNREIGQLTGPDPISYDPICFTSDGARLIATTRDLGALYVWDLRAIRQELRAMGMDWDLPSFSAESPHLPTQRVEVDRGWLAHEADFPDPRQAVTVFTVAIALQPFNPEAYMQRGRALDRLRRQNEAIQDYGMFLGLSPSDDPRCGEILFRRSSNYQLLGDWAAARRDLLAMVNLNLERLPWPALAAMRFQTHASKLALMREDDRSAEYALLLVRKALELDPESALCRGTVEYRLGHFADAAAVLERECESNTESAARALCFLATCRHRLGNRALAKRCLESAVRRHEENVRRTNDEENQVWDACRAEAESVLHLP